MPRFADGKALSDGWITLNKLKLLPLKDKIKRSHLLLEEKIKLHDNPVVCWSGGKDSTVALHLALQHNPDIPVIHVDTGVLFYETNDFIQKVSDEWNLNIKIVNSGQDNFWDICDKYGWPVYGKGISSNVGRAIRTGNIRDKLSRLEKIMIENNVRLSMKCAEFLLDKPTKKAEKELDADLKIIGIRALESRTRVRMWVDYGDCYYVKRYYKRNEGIWKLSPISIWSVDNVWEYHKKKQLPHCELYDIGYTRNGCWTCAMAIRNGQLNKLKKYNLELFTKLFYESDMGLEITKSYRALEANKHVIGFNLDFFNPILEDIRKIESK